MEFTQRELILNLYLFSSTGEIAVVERGDDDVYEQNIVSHIILTCPIGKHPVQYLRDYILGKGLTINEFKMLPALYQNKFDYDPHIEYIVISFLAKIQESDTKVAGDKENKIIRWMSLDEYKKHPNLMPELKKSNFENMLNGDSLFYKGYYKDSDGSNIVLEWEEL